MPATTSFGETRMTLCPACGYPTLSDLCAPCAPMVAAARAASPAAFAAVAPAAFSPAA